MTLNSQTRGAVVATLKVHNGSSLSSASDQRLSILFKLNRQQSEAGVYNLSKLAKHLNVTMQEVHRNLNRLMDAGLIRKRFRRNIFLNNFRKYHHKSDCNF